VKLFNIDRHLGPNSSPEIVATRSIQQDAVDRRRDVYDSHRHRAFALAFYMTGNEIEAETIVTQTFIAAFSAVPEPGAQQVDSALVHELRQRFPLHERDLPATADARTHSAPHLSGRNVRRGELEEAIQTLPPSERLLFLLRDVEGYTPSAIGQLLNIPEAKVMRSLMSARIRLRQALTDTNLTDTNSEQREAA
jgi:RNA polymerase sigma factor (sigma-70 family)